MRCAHQPDDIIKTLDEPAEIPMITSHEARAVSEGCQLRAPVYGGYYWFPSPGPHGVQWSVVTCADLGLGPDRGHPDLWPKVIDRLAVAWDKKASVLRRFLNEKYTGLPRGRVTKPAGYIILHGDDAPVADWLPLVAQGFRLEGTRYRVVFDEHERTLPDDRRRLQAFLGPFIAATACKDAGLHH